MRTGLPLASRSGNGDRRTQDLIDHRFYRQKYNAEQALDSFAITAREEVDLESLTVALLGVMQGTIQPESLSLWLKNKTGE